MVSPTLVMRTIPSYCRRGIRNNPIWMESASSFVHFIFNRQRNDHPISGICRARPTPNYEEWRICLGGAHCTQCINVPLYDDDEEYTLSHAVVYTWMICAAFVRDLEIHHGNMCLLHREQRQWHSIHIRSFVRSFAHRHRVNTIIFVQQSVPGLMHT